MNTKTKIIVERDDHNDGWAVYVVTYSVKWGRVDTRIGVFGSKEFANEFANKKRA